ncbi:MAG: MFS transporter [Desulfomonile tiedjei]|uniref:MFS transporter n=1 Tax=Desulfomonile tiedjei TaxID=2358 RepID=A0A9D6Z5R3_9BACT|nr:MFS transporter [Desulfomonile tiedjei]
MHENFARKVLAYRWLIFWIMAAAYAFVYFHRLCPAVVALDLQETFQASGGFMGLLASAYFYPYALMQFPAGLLSDSLGPRKTVTFFLSIAAAGSVLFGLAPGVEVAVFARVLVGLGVSMVFIPAMKILSQWFRVTEFAFMTAILTTTGGIGALIAATPLAVMTGWIGWRYSFQIIGLGTLIIAVMVWLFVRNKPQDKGWPSLAEIDHSGPGTAAPPLTIPLWQGARRVVTEKYFWPIAAWFFFGCGVFFSFGGLWAGPYLQHVYGMTRAEAGNVLNMISVGMIFGSPLVSLLSDRVFYSRRRVLTLCSSVLVAVMVFLNVFHSGLPIWVLYPVFVVFSVTSSAIVVIGFATTKELFPIEIAGTSVGTMNLFPFLGGAIFQPALGRVLDAYSGTATGAYSLEAYKAMLLVLLAASIVTAASTLFMKETFPRLLMGAK